MTFEEFKNAISSKSKKPSWVSSVIRTPLSRNISVLDWNNVVGDIYKLANDTDAVCEYLKSLYTYLFATFATKLELDLTPAPWSNGYVYGFDTNGNPKAFRTENKGISGEDEIPTSSAVKSEVEDALKDVEEHYVKKDVIKYDGFPEEKSTKLLTEGAIRKTFDTFANTYDDIISRTKSETITECNEHTDNSVAGVQVLAQSAYDLASGRSKVLPVETFNALITRTLYNYPNYTWVKQGDIIMIAETGVPDFIVYSTVSELEQIPEDSILVSVDDIPTPSVGGLYTVTSNDGLRYTTIIAIESGIDLSGYATKQYVLDVETALKAYTNTQLTDFDTYRDTKVNAELKGYYKLRDLKAFSEAYSNDLNNLYGPESAGVYMLNGNAIENGTIGNAPSTSWNCILTVESANHSNGTDYGTIQTVKTIDKNHTQCEWHRTGYKSSETGEVVWGDWESYATDTELTNAIQKAILDSWEEEV